MLFFITGMLLGLCELGVGRRVGRAAGWGEPGVGRALRASRGWGLIRGSGRLAEDGSPHLGRDGARPSRWRTSHWQSAHAPGSPPLAKQSLSKSLVRSSFAGAPRARPKGKQLLRTWFSASKNAGGHRQGPGKFCENHTPLTPPPATPLTVKNQRESLHFHPVTGTAANGKGW